jgi:TatD-related deoxyribonuclease
VEAARRFRAAGGTHLFLATQNYEPGTPRALDDYRDQFETTERLARRLREEAEVTAYVVLAPYPVDLIAAAAQLGAANALELHRAALDLAGAWVRERRAVALGEVGWPHFSVPPEIAEIGSEAFRHALKVAHDVGCPVVVHSTDLDPAGYRNLAAEADRAGVPRHRVVKHYARQRVHEGGSGGIAPSYLARRELVREVLSDPGPWFLETDFLDDPQRPGAVLDLATVPRRAEAIARTDGGAERLRVPFVDSVERVYGWTPRTDGKGGA